ncbi:MAG TPA: hypothetical protein VIW24_13605 [Aldersonia sp.]
MARHRSSTPDLVAELLSAEFLDGGVAYSTLEALHRGEIDDWLGVLDRCDLLNPDEVREMADAWHRNPRTLLETLLTNADEMTQRRCRTTWAALDRLAPLVMSG